MIDHSWGEFEIQIRITFIPEAGEKPLVLFHHLKLHPWPTVPAIDALPNTEPPTPVDRQEPVHSWQYDEVRICPPCQLLAQPATDRVYRTAAVIFEHTFA